MSSNGTPVDSLIAERIGCAVSDLDNERLEKYQTEAFKRTLSYAKKHSDHYSELLKDTDPSDIKTLKDITGIPFTSEKDLAGNEWRFQCISSSKVQRIITVPAMDPAAENGMITISTSGTHGISKRLAFTETDISRAVDFIYRGYLTMNCSEGEKLLVMMSGSTPGSIGDMVIRAMSPLKMNVSVYGNVTDIKDAYERIMEFRPSVIEGVPWQTAAIASYGRTFGNPEKEFIRSVNLSADLAPDSLVQRISRLWDCTVHRHYGMTEMCIFGGVECGHGSGYHMRSCDLLFEIPDADETGKGEVIITTLGREAMPLIRYRTGDIGRIISDPCGCGCRIPRIEKLYGRKSDMIDTGAFKCFFSDIAGALYEYDAITDFDIDISSPGCKGNGTSKMILTVRALPGVEADKHKIRRILSERIPAGDYFNDENCLQILSEESLTFPSGYNLKKRVRYISKESRS